jgi:hypothetical protein
MPTRSKPASSPIWQPGRAPAGCKLYLPILAGSGPTLRDYSGQGNHATIVGTPIWQAGPYGAQLGGSTSNYATIDPPAQILGLAYPFWVACLFSNTSTASTYLFSQGSSSTNTPFIAIRVNVGVVGRISYFLEDDSNAATSTQLDGQPINDGESHVVACWSNSPSDHRIALDGGPAAASTGTIGTLTSNRLTLAALRRIAAASAFTGSVAALAAGSGALPDLSRLAQDWLSGTFRAIRPPPRAWTWVAAHPPWTVAPPGIPTAESFGPVALATAATLAVAGIASAEAFGPVALASSAAIAAAGIPSAESFGPVALATGTGLAAVGIPSAEAFGAVALAPSATLAAAGIPSAEAFAPADLAVPIRARRRPSLYAPPAARVVVRAWRRPGLYAPPAPILPRTPGPGGGLFPARLFPPRLFPRRLFPRASVPVPPEPPEPDVFGRDWTVVDAIVAALEATGSFAAVSAADDPTVRGRGAEVTPIAVVDLDGWDEVDDVDPIEQVRRLAGTIVVVHRGGTVKAQRLRDLDRLSSIVQDAVDGQSLAGFTLPALTKCRRGRYRARGGEESRLEIRWEATYLVEGYAGHYEADE